MIPIDQDEFENYDDLENEDEHEVEPEEVEEESDDEAVGPEVRIDKIFNNRYNTGEGMPEEEYSYARGISVSNDYSDAYLKDLYEYEEGLEIKVILDSIFSFIQADPDISKILRDSSTDPFSTKIKLSKEQINFIFNRVNDSMASTYSTEMFYSPIYILEVISSISSIEYKKLFDILDTEIQELLLLELNKKYQFLDGKMHKKRIH